MRKGKTKQLSALAVNSKKASVGMKIVRIVFAVFLFVLIIFPFYWIILSSFKNFLEIFEVPIRFLPKRIDFTNYIEAFTEYHIGTYLMNSVIVTLVTVILTTSISTMASFSLTRLQFKGSKAFVKFLQMSQMFPVVVILVPLYLMCTRMGLVGSRRALILPYVAIQIPVSVILLSTYFVDIPKEIEEAAMIDGCSLFQLFFRIMLPLATSGIVAVSIYTFIQVWQEFLIASSFVRKQIHYTLTVGLSTFKGEFINWGGLMATSVIIAIPAMILFTTSQDFFINRLAGSVKE